MGSSATRLYAVTVYLEDDDDMDDQPAEYAVVVSAHGVGAVRMRARSEVEAAAKAWVRLVGVAREKATLKLKAPHRVVAEQTSIRATAAQIEECDVWCGQLKLNNMVETWYFSVGPAEALRGEP